MLFIDYLFYNWNFRKIYAEALEFNLDQFASGLGRYLVEEGRLRQHEYACGKLWDLVMLAIYREAWESAGNSLRKHVVARARR